MKSKNIFLTGASGLVGTQIVESLYQNNFNIKALSRKSRLSVNKLEWILGDHLISKVNLCKKLKGIDTIIHNGASIKVGLNKEENFEIESVNIDFTKKILDCTVNEGVKKIIFTSTLSFIKKPLPGIITESSLLNPLTKYAESKYICEELIKDYSKKYGIKYFILRLSSPVSFDLNLMHNTVVKNWILKSRKGEKIQIYGNGSRTQDFVSTKDIANCMISCINKEDKNGVFNVASGNSISMLELAKLISSKFGNNYDFRGQDEYEKWNISIDKSKNELNYNPIYNSTDSIKSLLNRIDS
jgi:UDP-glucose 4-epimerase